MKNKRLEERKQLKKVGVKHIIREEIISGNTKITIDNEMEKLYKKYGNKANSKMISEKALELLTSGKINLSDISGYIVDKIGSNGKKLETYAITSEDVKKYYTIEMDENFIGHLKRKPLIEIEEDIPYNEIKEIVSVRLSFDHLNNKGEFEKVFLNSRFIITNEELENHEIYFDKFKDKSSELMMMKSLKTVFDLYGGNINTRLNQSITPISIKSDFSRKYNIKKRYEIDINQKLMILKALTNN